MLRSETNVARLVVLLVPSQGVQTRRTRRFVEPEGREQPAACLDTLQGRAFALVWHRRDVKAGGADVVLESDRGDGVFMGSIMR